MRELGMDGTIMKQTKERLAWKAFCKQIRRSILRVAKSQNLQWIYKIEDSPLREIWN